MNKEKIYEVIKIIEENHIDAYFNITKDELYNYIDEILNKYELKDECDFYYICNVIIKKMFGTYDSHTKLLWKNIDKTLPLRFKFIDGKLYIIRTDEENKDLLYSEVLKLNDIDVKQIEEEIKNMIPYSTNKYLETNIEITFYNGYKLRTLPSIKSDTKNFEFEVLKDNKTIKKSIVENNCLLTETNKPKDNYTFELMNDAIYIVYNKCKEDYEGQMVELVNKIKKISEENNINKYIIDIRGNTGGNSCIINPLIDFLQGKTVITLVDKDVFSGGRFAIFDLKNVNSKFVGTEIGTTLNCFGNAPSYDYKDFIIPISNKYFYMDTTYKHENFKYADTKEKFKELKQNKELFVPQIFKPDFYVENNIEDYKNGYDRQLHTAQLLISLEFNNDKNKKILKFENEKFIIYYNDCDKLYIDKMVNIITQRMPEILSFFKIKYNKKIIIKLYDNVEEYKRNIENSFKVEAEIESEKQGKIVEPRKYQDWMIANTEDGNINMQSLDLIRLNNDFSDYTEKEFLFNACHEFTHLCQQQVGSNNPGWFWEVIATALGNPECQHETNNSFTIQDLDERFDEIDGYGAVYKIGKYLFENYDYGFILSLVYDNDKMYETIIDIISKINQDNFGNKTK